MVQAVLETLAREELQRRETEDVDEEPPPRGGFSPWQEVFAQHDLRCGQRGATCVQMYTPGIVVCPFGEDRLTVKFDQRADGSDLCVNVLPHEIAHQLPKHFKFRAGQRVVASQDLMFGENVGVRFAVGGIVRGQCSDPERLVVHFDERVDGSQEHVSVQLFEVHPGGPHAGGFEVGQRVAAAQDLIAGETTLVRRETPGVVLGPYSDTRVTVQFDTRVDGNNTPVNVTSSEIRLAQ